MSELGDAIQLKFAHLSERELIARMNRAPDFSYDDEEVELTRRLGARALAWRWSDDLYEPRVVIYAPEGES